MPSKSLFMSTLRKKPKNETKRKCMHSCPPPPVFPEKGGSCPGNHLCDAKGRCSTSVWVGLPGTPLAREEMGLAYG
ncbi:hypothetical protein TNCV_5136311 [Trichonephila clavipes]|nr:hypothetical protein TNCV_5136311 [Trichonephila clavipes]